jgi:LacI family transcriptional regulator
MDNRSAGATAAYLVNQWLGEDPAQDGRVLVALSRSVFRGEEEREIGFRSAIRERWPHRGLTEITDSDGLDTSVYRLALDALDRHADIEAVYSIGGGNRAILDAFDARRRPCRAFIAHDLDRDNRKLLEAGRLSAVLYHDLRRDMHRACQIIMQAHGALDGPIVTAPAPIQVITPFNIPPETPSRAPRSRTARERNHDDVTLSWSGPRRCGTVVVPCTPSRPRRWCLQGIIGGCPMTRCPVTRWRPSRARRTG